MVISQPRVRCATLGFGLQPLRGNRSTRCGHRMAARRAGLWSAVARHRFLAFRSAANLLVSPSFDSLNRPGRFSPKGSFAAKKSGVEPPHSKVAGYGLPQTTRYPRKRNRPLSSRLLSKTSRFEKNGARNDAGRLWSHRSSQPTARPSQRARNRVRTSAGPPGSTRHLVRCAAFVMLSGSRWASARFLGQGRFHGRSPFLSFGERSRLTRSGPPYTAASS